MKKVLLKTFVVSIVVLLLPFLLTLLLSADFKGNFLMNSENFELYYSLNGKEERVDFEKYLIGVVAANMPAGYHMEALKAQAIIARTYTLYNISLLLEEDPKKVRFNTSELGLSYIGLDSLEQYWGSEDYLSYFTKIENAVYSTKNTVLLYNNSLILPVFFSNGSGYTRNANEAWGINIPYLKSVPSKQDVTSTNYLNIKEYNLSELISTLEIQYSNLSLNERSFFDEVKVTGRDSTSYVTKVNLGNQTISGEVFAKVLGLNSNHFYIEDYDGKVRIICTGVGHGVGFSQYGANAMAIEGSTFSNILLHYYTGVELADMN